MKKIFFSILYFIILVNYFPDKCYTSDSIVNKSQNTYVTDLDIAFELAEEEDKKIIVIFSASWCGFCDNLKKDLPDLSGFDNTIICILDIDEYKRTSRKYKIRSLPTSIVLKSKGEEISRIVGYDKKTYEKWLENNK